MERYSSYYALLQISENATVEEIKAAYRKQALAFHPDVNNNSVDSQTKFILIANAYAVLSDSGKRNDYDSYIRSSASVQNRGNKSGKTMERTQVQPYAKGSSQSQAQVDTREKFENQFNYILWDIEDLLLADHDCRRAKAYDELYFQKCIMRILTFIDKWVLQPSGLVDYFMQARNLKDLDPGTYIDAICQNRLRLAHFPFTSVSNYFYDIRKRMNKFIDSLNRLDILRLIPGTEVRNIDALIEAQNYAFYYLGNIKKLINTEITEIPDFSHSTACFQLL